MIVAIEVADQQEVTLDDKNLNIEDISYKSTF